MRLKEIVDTSAAVAATRARSTKMRLLAELLRHTPADDVAVVVGYLVGAPRQGRIGLGWSTLGATQGLSPAAEPTLTVAHVDAALDAIQRTTGSGSVASRRAVLAELIGRATEDEADFLRRLLLGEVRQGALEGLMADAIAAAADVPA